MQTSVLLSIKPKYVDAIVKGEKKYEFRKKIFKSNNVKKIYIYSSSPVQKIIGYFELNNVFTAHPKDIWEKCSKYGGIDETNFFQYYEGRDQGYSLFIENLVLFDEAICPYSRFEAFIPPQSYIYFDSFLKKLL
ncbi:ASCH domain-containing protein [Sulfurovum sp.]|uniref:ASCH domain-containing protein n=1 Tax=Sulfurovum sp. TaxID=1969726 RepID=UPI0035612D2A